MRIRPRGLPAAVVFIFLAFGVVGSAQASAASLSCANQNACVTAGNPTVLTVQWEPNNWPSYPWNKLGFDVSQVQTFLGNLNESSYSNLLAQYASSAGIEMDKVNYGGSCTVADSTGGLAGFNPAHAISNETLYSMINKCITSSIQAGRLQWTPSANTIYLLYPPEAMYFNDPSGTKTSFVDMCGYHSQHNNALATVIYGVIASPAGSGACVPAPTYEGDAIWLTSHELFEAITDPGPGNVGWFDQSPGTTNGFEIADECNSDNKGISFNPGKNVNLNGTTYLLPGMWSNYVGGCSWSSFQAQVSATVTGTRGQNDWYTSNVGLHWDIRPGGANSRKITDGCVNQTITTDQNVTSYWCTVQGLNFLNQVPWGPPFAGKAQIKRDSSPPVFTGFFIPGTPFLLGQTFTPTPSASDATSLIASKSCPTLNTATVQKTSVTCSATNFAGLTSTALQGYEVVKAATSLTNDAGFETPAKTQPVTTVTSGQVIGPWHVTSGSVDVVRSSYWQPAAGSQSLDLAGTAPGSLSQTITLAATGTYVARFKFAGNPDCAPTTKHMGVSATSPTWAMGQFEGLTFNTTGHTRASMGWKAGSLEFDGTTGDVVTLSFTDQSGSSCGMALDAVTVKGK